MLGQELCRCYGDGRTPYVAADVKPMATRMTQLSLLDPGPSQSAMNRDAATQGPVERRVRENKIHVTRSTFKAGLEAPVHRWFRLTPSFGPDLVQHILLKTEAQREDVVLDPFCGAGTTGIECKGAGRPFFGFEINPFLHFVGVTSLRWELDPLALNADLTHIEHEFCASQRKFENVEVESTGMTIPPIHNVFRWWRKDVLKDMLCVKRAIEHSCSKRAAARDFFFGWRWQAFLFPT